MANLEAAIRMDLGGCYPVNWTETKMIRKTVEWLMGSLNINIYLNENVSHEGWSAICILQMFLGMKASTMHHRAFLMYLGTLWSAFQRTALVEACLQWIYNFGIPTSTW